MNNRARILKDILWIFVLSGLIAAIFRMVFGLGPTTNLTDGVPWGFWKVLNMIAGVALSTSGFTVGFLVYVLRLNQFKPFMKPAILIAFLGYACSCLALLFDIGLPLRFWHPLIMWNINSFLFEVFWCVLLYFTITAIEFAPLIFDKLKLKKISGFLHNIAIVAVITGISLSSLHHSSLGSLFLVSPQRLHAYWYSPWLPLFFILSAMGAGMMFVVFVKLVWSSIYNPIPIYGIAKEQKVSLIHVLNGSVNSISSRYTSGPEMKIITKLATIGAGLLSIYFVIRIIDLISRGLFTSLFNNSPESWLVIIELGFGVLVPLILLFLPRTRILPIPVGIAALLASLGLVLNRLNVGIFGYFRDAGEVYFPSLTEWVLGIGVIAFAGLLFLYLSEILPIFDNTPLQRTVKGTFQKRIGSLHTTWNIALSDSLHRVSLIAVLIIPIAYVIMYPPFQDADAAIVKPSLGLDSQRQMLLIDGNRKSFSTTFNHLDHQQRLNKTDSCLFCHHVSLPADRSTPCSRCHQHLFEPTNIFNHEEHTFFVAESNHLIGWHPENESCYECHLKDQPKSKKSAKDCFECHKDDMFLMGRKEDNVNLTYASSFCDAMHGTCLECHKKEVKNSENKNLDKCSTCHKTLEKTPVNTRLIAQGQ